MNDDDGAITSELAIELDHVGAELDGSQECCSRIFRAVTRRPAMSDAKESSTLRHACRLTEIAVESESIVWHKVVVNRWLEVSVTVPPDASDALTHHLIEIGAPGTIEEDVSGDRRRIRAHFRSTTDPESLSRRLRLFLTELDADFPGCALAPLDLASIDEEDWAEGWKQGFPPLEIGRSLRVRPPWLPPSSSGRLDIEIQPAMAFGTGQHASTVGCLLAMEDLFGREGVLSPVLDVGTGSGILGIAAARLGARQVVALDVDSVAAEAAQENVRRNGLDGIVSVQQGTANELTGSFALILANLYAGLLRSLFPVFARLVIPGGWLITAGLLDLDRPAVAEAATASGWRLEEARSRESWTTLVFRMESGPAS